MNTKLLSTRLQSIANYTQQIKDLEESLRVTMLTREQLIDTTKEFCPFNKGDIICRRGKQIMMFESVSSCGILNSSGEVYLTLNILHPNAWGNFENRRTENYFFKNSNQWEVLRYAKSEPEIEKEHE